MLTPSMEPEGSGQSLKAPIHSNGLAIAAKMAGANIGSTGDGSPPTGCQEPQKDNALSMDSSKLQPRLDKHQTVHAENKMLKEMLRRLILFKPTYPNLTGENI